METGKWQPGDLSIIGPGKALAAILVPPVIDLGNSPPLTQYHTTLDDLMFYLDLTRCTAWASLLAVVEASGEAREDIDSV
jgi:hypothetical protein